MRIAIRACALILFSAIYAAGLTPKFAAFDPAEGQSASVSAASEEADVMAWREERVAGLKKDWLVLAGLFWLKEGSNHFGSSSDNEIQLETGKAPEHAGAIDMHEGKCAATILPNIRVTVDGKAVDRFDLADDSSGSAAVLELGDLRMHIIKRGDRFGLRVKDLRSKTLLNFHGLKYFPISTSYRVRATFVSFTQPRELSVPNVLGQTIKMQSPGYAEFTLRGRKLKLQSVLEEPGAKELFFIFKDQTSGKQTYPAGRFLYSSLPKDGKLVLDFNKAYSPPCAFTPYATCPLPPPQNVMKIAIEGGELFEGH